MQTLSESRILALIEQEKTFECRLEGGSLTLKIDEYVPTLCTAIHNGHLLRAELAGQCLLSAEENCAADSCRIDAHGITGRVVRNVTIRNTEIHTFSGDAIQFDPARALPGWSGVTIEGCRFWLAPLPAAVGGYAAGMVPGENAVDTKTSNDVITPAELTIRDTTAWGFRGGVINNMAIVSEGLSAGDVVAVAGLSFLSEGQKVKLMASKENAPKADFIIK